MRPAGLAVEGSSSSTLGTFGACREAGAGESPWAILGQAQHCSQWRFCLRNICRRPFGENNPGSAGQAAASRGAAASFLLFLARLPSCLFGPTLGAVSFRAACSFQCLQLPSSRAARRGRSPEAVAPGPVPGELPLPCPGLPGRSATSGRPSCMFPELTGSLSDLARLGKGARPEVSQTGV